MAPLENPPPYATQTLVLCALRMSGTRCLCYCAALRCARLRSPRHTPRSSWRKVDVGKLPARIFRVKNQTEEKLPKKKGKTFRKLCVKIAVKIGVHRKACEKCKENRVKNKLHTKRRNGVNCVSEKTRKNGTFQGPSRAE